MDRFRFRAWVGPDNAMIYWETPDIPEEVSNKTFLSEYLQTIWDSDYDDNIILMLCTGLKDSEGNLIWEGDVVETLPMSQWRYHPTKLIVEYGGCAFIFVDENNKTMDTITNRKLTTVMDMKVIGNIYEHPDLIKTPPPPSQADSASST